VNGGNTVIRSGYGIYYGRYPGAMINSLFTTNNLYQQSLTLQTSAAGSARASSRFSRPFYLSGRDTGRRNGRICCA